MPPKPVNSVDGISRPTATASNTPATQILSAPPTGLEPRAPEMTSNTQKSTPKAQVKTTRTKRGPVIPILVTLIAMVLLIGLAYFAYNKSK